MIIQTRKPESLFIYCVIALMSFASGCTRHSDKYGGAFNPARVKRGIPIIPSNWSITDFGQYFDCVNPNVDQTKPHHLSKRVFVGKDGQINGETDQFYSGKMFVDPDGGNMPQKLGVTYYYTQEKAGNPWLFYLTLGANESMREITLQEADGILDSWGLKR